MRCAAPTANLRCPRVSETPVGDPKLVREQLDGVEARTPAQLLGGPGRGPWYARDAMKWITAALLAAALSACAEDDDHGTAPSLASISLNPDHVAIGVQAMVTGTLAFTDPDGDVETIELDLGSPDGTHSAMEVEVSGADGVAEGTVAFSVIVKLPAAGSYPIAAQLIDAEGNASNTKSTPLRAQ
jgi:hypothetical protein